MGNDPEIAPWKTVSVDPAGLGLPFSTHDPVDRCPV